MNLFTTIQRLLQEDEGATMAEYAIMAGFIAAVCAVSVAALGLGVEKLFIVPWP